MSQQLIILLTLSFAICGNGKSIDLLLFGQTQTLPASQDLIPVYTAIEDFALPYNGPGDQVATNLVFFKPLENTDIKQEELRNLDSISTGDESELDDYELYDSDVNGEARNLQFPPGLEIPAIQAPELTNFQLPTIPSTALKRTYAPSSPETASSGRTFKHFLLLKGLLGSGGHGGGDGGGGGYGGGHGGYGGIMYPIIINTPVNVSNWNNNTAVNTPAPAAAAAAAGLEDAVRIQYIGVPQTQSLPMPMQMPAQVYHQPTPVYQQRQAVATAQPTYAFAMLPSPSAPFLPFALPQYQSTGNHNRDVERRHSLDWSNAAKLSNPWSAFANNLRGMQIF